MTVSPPSPQHQQPGLLECLWKSGLWRFMPFVFIYMFGEEIIPGEPQKEECNKITGLALLFPIVPTIVTNGFASEALGRKIDCQVFVPENSPKECREAHAKAVTMGSWTSFVSGSILSFLCSPVTGHLSDQYGRKPFMLVGIALGLAPVLAIMFNLWGWLPIIWYYPADALNGIVSSFSITLTAVADVMRQEHRAAGAACITGMFSLALIAGPGMGGSLDPLTAVYVCLALILVAMLYVLLFVPECAPRRRKAAADASEPAPLQPPAARLSAQLRTLSTGWRVLIRSSWFVRMAIMWGLISVMTNGTTGVLFQYLQLQLGFTTPDQAHVLVVLASVALAVKVVVLGFLIQHLGDQLVIALGLMAYVAEFLLLAAATTKPAAVAAVGVGALAAIVWPATIALQSSRADPAEWGAVAGALQAVGSLSTGLGPLLFAALFSAFSHDKKDAGPGSLPYFPQIVWYVAAGFAGIAVLLASTLHWGDRKHSAAAKAGLGAGAAPAPGAEEGEQEGSAPPAQDPWTVSRTMSLKSCLDRLGSIASKGAGNGEGGRAGKGDLEQPLLEEEGDAAHEAEGGQPASCVQGGEGKGGAVDGKQ